MFSKLLIFWLFYLNKLEQIYLYQFVHFVLGNISASKYINLPVNTLTCQSIY